MGTWGEAPAVTIVGIFLVGVIFALHHVRQHVAVAPPIAAKLRPLIVVMTTATDKCQVVDTRRATETSTSRVCQLLFSHTFQRCNNTVGLINVLCPTQCKMGHY